MSKRIKYIDGHLIEYEVLKLVDKYDPILYTPTQELDFNDLPINLAYLTLSMVETMSKHGGLGISANQVGFPYRVCSVNLGEEVLTMYNPKLLMYSGAISKMKEGCLSFPGLFLQTGRFDAVVVEFQRIDGEKVTKSFEGIAAICVQHELDHLDGVAFTKRVSPIVLEREQRKMKKNMKKMRQVMEEEARKVSY